MTNVNASLDKLSISSFNCRGLRDKLKRNSVFNWLKSKYLGLFFLQETHSIGTDESIWTKEWNGKIYFSHGNSQSKGVAVLIPEVLVGIVNVSQVTSDPEGRFIVLDCEIEGNAMVLFNIYAPTKDKVNSQLNFF